MKSTALKQTILPVLCVTAGSLVFGALADDPQKYAIGICFTSAVTIFGIIMKRDTACKQAILNVLCFAAGSVICAFANQAVLGICMCCAVSIASSFVQEQKRIEEFLSFPHK